MTFDEIREIADIVRGDKTYRHFVKRINKEFENAGEERNSKVYVIFINDFQGRKIGFSVIGHSPAKMRVWQETFLDEGWVDNDFKMKDVVNELMYMYVVPEYRNKGISTELFKKTINHIKNKNVEEVYAYVGDRTSQALDFYKRMNAEIIAEFSDEESSSAFLRWQVS
jgi:GNAT superfamily N-acetyltransferase